MTTEQRESYNLDSLAGKQIDALVSKEPNKDGTAIYNNIQSFEKCEKELEAMEEVVTTKDTTVKTTAVEVPAQAPAEPETAESFIESLGKEEAEEEDEEQKALEVKLAALKAKKEKK
jgi:hypothetical protein